MTRYGKFSRNEYFTCPAFPLESVVDPTGAGDTFAGGFMGALSRMGRPTETNFRRAVVYGCVLASFAVEEFGVGALLRVDRDEVMRRAEAISAMSRVNLDNTARVRR